jgi:iron complex outermembrane receptor protein
MRYWLMAALALCPAAAQAQAPTRGLADLSLEQLSNIVVSTVSRREEPLSRAPASIYVITGDDIRRSGATSLPEALRLAPNLQVARVDSSQYAITARGFNSTTANKLLVLIDGRTVYTPLFSGTFWEAQDAMLEDIERIEVISGPGATLWGANAVNGVINVITRSAAATQGSVVALGAGNEERQAAARRGGELDNGGHYRVYAKGLRRDATERPGGLPNDDRADLAQAGFRADWGRAADGFTVQGDFYNGEVQQPGEPREIEGANLLGRWTRDFGGGGLLRVQAYFDHTHREHPDLFKEDLNTYDLEVQHGLRAYGRHRLLWGVGARRHEDRIGNSAFLAFLPAERSLTNAHVFVQDEIALREGLDLTLGAKAERNSYTGAEFLPSARLAWQPSDTQLVWTALSRAVRAPARLDRDFFVPGLLAGGPGFQSEVSRVLEVGYRAQAAANLSFSITAFRHEHEKLRSLAPAPGGVAVIANDREGRTSGIEAWGSWRGGDWWRIDAGAVHLDQRLGVREGAVDLQPLASLGADPESWAKVRAAFDLGGGREVDVMARHYGALETRDVPSYTALDARLGWRPRRGLELSLLLQNLLDAGHVEWDPGAELGRAAYVKLRVDL